MPASNGPAAHPYRGRFAPSPTGELHAGSLLTAVASYADALAHDGEWLVRIEDIDPPRETPGAAAAILRTLELHGFCFPAVFYQSTRLEVYREILAGLLDEGLAYRCACTRQQLERTARPGRCGLIYPGTCRAGIAGTKRPARAIRLRTTAARLCFEDPLQGRVCCNVADEIGDFLLQRGDGRIAYQAAVVIDDIAQEITHVVRGTDLLDATFMQLCVYQALGHPAPEWLHVPVLVDAGGHKLAKARGAPPVNNKCPGINIFEALSRLSQNPPSTLRGAPPREIWAWARTNWDSSSIKGIRTLPDRSMMTE